MSRSAPLLALALVLPLVAGCVTVHTFGTGREPLVKSTVFGTTGPEVLLLDIDDVITEVDVRGPLGIGRRESTVARVREQLDKAADAGVAGVLLRVNSPGGGVTASDVVYREVLRFKEERNVPVVAVMMGVAASGGYYVAMASDWIVAHPTTVTGSIGVISAGINVAGLMDRYGVEDQTFTAGAFKDAGSPLRPMTDAERAYIQDLMDDLHLRFRQVVQEGRPGLTPARVQELADGRVFTASQAHRLGLVDMVGYMPDAVDELKRRIQAPEIRVISFHREREYQVNLYSTAPALSGSAAAEQLGVLAGPRFLYLWSPGGLPAARPPVVLPLRLPE